MQTAVTDVENIDENSIDGWQPITIDEAFEFTRKPRSLDIPEGEPIPFIPMDGISESSRKINYAENRTLEEIKSGSFVFKDDLLIAKITPSFENGKQAILADLSNDYGYATTEVWVLHPKKKVKMLTEYLFYYLRRGKVRSDLAGKMEGSTGRQRLPKGVLKSLEFNSPPLNEQQKIVSILNTIQDAIKQTEAVIQATRELKKSLMKHLFTYGPVPVDQTDQVELKETEVGVVPSEWKVIELKKLYRERVYNGAFVKKDKFGEGTPFLNVKDTYKSLEVSPSQLERVNVKQTEIDKYRLKNGDLIYVRSSLKREGVGNCCIFESSDKEVIYDCHLMRVRIDTQKANPKFLAYYSNSPSGKEELIAKSKTTTMTTINQASLGSLKVPLPPVQKQNRIVHAIDLISEKEKMEIDKKKSIEALFNSLLENLMTAKVRVV